MPAAIRRETQYCNGCYGRFTPTPDSEYRADRYLCPRCRPRMTLVRCASCGFLQMPGEMSHAITDHCYECADRVSFWPVGTFNRRTNESNELRSLRGFGIEIETSRCHNHTQLRNNTLWGAKPDGSIPAVEFISPILSGDEGLANLREFMAFSRRNRWRADSDCGLHIHLDMREMTNLQLRHIAYAYSLTSPYWRKMVNAYRDTNCSYCHEHNYNTEELITTTWQRFVGRRERYDGFNWAAYNAHGSLEIRLHQGTVVEAAIVNWIKAHLRFTDYVAPLKFHQIRNRLTRIVQDSRGNNVRKLNADAFVRILGTDVAPYYARKVRRNVELRDAFSTATAEVPPRRRRRGTVVERRRRGTVVEGIV